jgi:hypothetical protein
MLKGSVVLVFFVGLLLVTCTPPEPRLGVADARLVGTWRLSERRLPTDSTRVARAVPATPAQTFVFTEAGTFRAQGEELEYYLSSRYYRLDTTLRGQLRLGFIIDKLNPAFYQRLRLSTDSLWLFPSCEGDCSLTFVRER